MLLTRNESLLPANRLLSALPKKEYRSLQPELTQVNLNFGETVYEAGETVKHVYFPNNSIISLLSTVSDRSTLEVGMVGNEGMAGISVFMGVNKSGTRALVQGDGSAMRMRTATFLKLLDQATSLRALLHRYTFALFTQISQSSACNRFHKTDERLARWLLMTSDRVGSDEFRLTQEFLAQMVGVRREAVNKSSNVLLNLKLINYSRGAMAILNRAGLEAVACSCYGIIRQSENFLAEPMKHLRPVKHLQPEQLNVRQRTVR